MLLERDGEFHYAENVNKLVSGKAIMLEECRLAPNVNENQSGHIGVGTDARIYSPKQLLFTSSGRIALLSTVGKATSILLSRLNMNMEKVLRGPDGFTHHR